MAITYQGTDSTLAMQKGAVGAAIAIVLPYGTTSDDPPPFLDPLDNLRVLKVSSETNTIVWWNGTAWVSLAEAYSITQFKVGDPLFPDAPADGTKYYTNANFAGASLDIRTSDVAGDLFYSIDYIRTDGVDGDENPLGDTVELLAPYLFLDDSKWTFEKGKGMESAAEVIASVKSYAYNLFSTVVGGIGVASPTSSPIDAINVYYAYVEGIYANFLSALATPIEVEESDLVNGYVVLVRNPDTGFFEKKQINVPVGAIEVEGNGSNELVDARMIGRKVLRIWIGNTSGTTSGFTKSIPSDTLTNIDTIPTGRKVTILFE